MASDAVNTFRGSAVPDGSVPLGYEETLAALLALLGRPVLVLFSGTDGSPFVAGVLSGRLDRGELDRRLQEVLLRADAAPVETLFFHVGSRETGFVLRPDDFVTGFAQGSTQLTIHLGSCAVTILTRSDLDQAMSRE
jgi:hypothetical protein